MATFPGGIAPLRRLKEQDQHQVQDGKNQGQVNNNSCSASNLARS
ncbi:hypothetical protein [Lactobacillus equicursoris]